MTPFAVYKPKWPSAPVHQALTAIVSIVMLAGCSSGEEVYSLAILLREEGLLERSIIYATDINQAALKKAEAGVYELDRIPGFTSNHQKSGAKG